ncbi:hypothetical protein PRIPAC_83922 [Pristionchus pacificus]|uniref:Uncharacterized protein n=1 Tax=Pristionchus pacificus TaxID=54126 RepID=A0A2A6BNJ3_PRIPA|nr:hypothetical protein PRIPAC_83922 [Pristionchus pacificus]|eukprot:PDM67386.1 hypothetical protein PRIPAC_48803 [Pristionchus pacificus]
MKYFSAVIFASLAIAATAVIVAKPSAAEVAKMLAVSSEMTKIFTDSFANVDGSQFNNNCKYNNGKSNMKMAVGSIKCAHFFTPPKNAVHNLKETLATLKKSIAIMLKKNEYSAKYSCNNEKDAKHKEHMARGGTACTVTMFPAKKPSALATNHASSSNTITYGKREAREAGWPTGWGPAPGGGNSNGGNYGVKIKRSMTDIDALQPGVHVDSQNTGGGTSNNNIKVGKREAGGWDVDIQSTNTGNANSQNTVTYNKREAADSPSSSYGSSNSNSDSSSSTDYKKREAANSPSVHVDSSNTASSTNDIIFNKREAAEEQNYSCSCSDINNNGNRVCNECDGSGCRNAIGVIGAIS